MSKETVEEHKICSWCNKDITGGVETCQYVGCAHLSTDTKVHVPEQYPDIKKEEITPIVEKETEKAELVEEEPKPFYKKIKLKEKVLDIPDTPDKEEEKKWLSLYPLYY